MAGNLKLFRRLLREYKLISDSSKVPGEFQVISIYTYSADSNFLKALTPPLEGSKEVIYLYDVLLSDGADKLKCFLALPLGHLVQKFMLKVGCFVQIEKAKLCYLEGEYNDAHIVQYVFLEALKIVEYTTFNLPALGSLNFLESTNYRETELVPLVTGRKCYMYPWVPVYPQGEEWLDDSSLQLNGDGGFPQNIFPLKDVADDWMRMPRPYPTLFVRMLARGMLYYYGFNKNDKAYPFMGRLILGDSSGVCTCISFGKINLSLYYNLSPGCILLLEGYSLKRPQQPILPQMRGAAANLPIHDLEIIVGDFATLKVVPENHGPLLMQVAILPALEFAFANRAEIQFAANESTVDIVGVVTYVSLFHRFLFKFGKIYARCYVELIDRSSHLPFVAILYDNGFRFPMSDLHPGQVLVATHMKVMHLPDEMLSSYDTRIYLKATHFSEVFTAHSLSSPYLRCAAVSSVANIISQHAQEVSFLQSHVLRAGGYPTFLRGYRNLETYRESFGHSLAGKMIPGAYWKLALESLQHRERRCVTLGGFITQVDYVDLSTVDATPTWGWRYSGQPQTRRTLFVNVKARFRLASGTLNVDMDERMAFAAQYSSQHESCFKDHRRFPPTRAEDYGPPQNGVEDFPILADGYYIITIASLHFQASLQCLFIPEPTSTPHPSLVDLLSGHFQVLPLQPLGPFTYQPPTYSWNEVREVSQTASQVGDRTFVFAMELHRPKPDTFQAHMVRAYICPPDQMEEAMAADRML